MKEFYHALKTIVLMFAFTAGLLLSMTIAIFSLAYIVTGFSKNDYMEMLNKIPKETFGWIIIPTTIMAFGVAAWCYYQLFEVSLGKDKEKKLYEKRFIFEAGREYYQRSLMTEDKENYTFPKFCEKNNIE